MIMHVSVVPQKEQRYNTCGDWNFLEENLHVLVSDTGNRASNVLIAIHEVVEAVLCRESGIRQQDVDAFDMEFEKNRSPGDESEPGNNPLAPYYEQHVLADAIERIIAREMGVDWREHEERILAL